MTFRTLLSTLVFLLFSFSIFSQCDLPSIETVTRIQNDYRISHSNAGGAVSHFSSEPDAYYYNPVVPIFSNFSTRGLWLGGFDPAGNLRLAISEYNSNNSRDYQQGPILDLDPGEEEAFCAFYNRVWSIYEEDLVELKNDFNSAELKVSDIAADILEWPAKNNPHIGQFAVDYDMAPFFDFNSDGNYNPLDGDYPIAIKESPEFSAYAFSFKVYNDNGVHTLSRSYAIGMELHQMNYLTQCPSTEELDKSIFYRIKYIYKGNEGLSEFKIGLWEDADLGCVNRNYSGCSEDLRAIYIYTKNTTGMRCGFSQDIPVNSYAIRSTVLLNQDLLSHIAYSRSGFGGMSPQTTDPTNVQSFYNYLSVKWLDGTPLTYGGTGYDESGNGDITTIAYPDFPNDPDGWSMLADSLPLTDIKSVTTIYDDDLVPGQEGIIDFVDHIMYSAEYNDASMFEIYPDAINTLRSEYNTALSGDLECNISSCFTDCVWPGDINSDNVVDGHDIILSGVFSGQGNTQGPPREYDSIRWAGFSSDDWDEGESIGSINAKYGDVNGEGIIDTADFYYTTLNYGKSHSNYQKGREELTTEGDVNLIAKFEIDSVGLDTASLFSRLFVMELYVGDQGELLSEPIHGLTFEMQLDSQLIENFGGSLWINRDSVFQYNTTLTYEQSGTLGSIIDNNGPIVLSNYNGEDQTEGFLIFNSTFYIKDNAATNNPDGRDTLRVRFFNVKAINAAGEMIDVGDMSDELILTNMTYDPNLISSQEELDDDNSVLIYPNPVDDILTIKSAIDINGSVRITDISGRVVIVTSLSGGQESHIDVSSLETGIYLLSYRNDVGIDMTYRFVKV